MRCCQLSFVGWKGGIEVNGERRDGRLNEVRRVVVGERSLRVVRFGRVASEVWRMENTELVEETATATHLTIPFTSPLNSANQLKPPCHLTLVHSLYKTPSKPKHTALHLVLER